MTDTTKAFDRTYNRKHMHGNKEVANEPMKTTVKPGKEKSLTVCANRRRGWTSRQDYLDDGKFKIVSCLDFATIKGENSRGEAQNGQLS